MSDALIPRHMSQGLVNVKSCSGSRIYCRIVSSFCRGSNRPLATAVENKATVAEPLCLPLVPDIYDLLSVPALPLHCEKAEKTSRGISQMEAISPDDDPSDLVNRCPPKIAMPDAPGHQKLMEIAELRSTEMPITTAPGVVVMANNATSRGAPRQRKASSGTRCSAHSPAVLKERVSGWIQSVESSEKRAQTLAQESAELRDRLEKLLKDIVTTRTHVTPRPPRFTNPSRTDRAALSSPIHPYVALESTATDLKASCCRKQTVSGSLCSTGEEDESFPCTSSDVQRDAVIDGSRDSGSEDDAETSAPKLGFEEDVQSVLQSIWMSHIGEEADRKLDEMGHETEGDEEILLLTELPQKLDVIPEALRSAYDINTPCCTVSMGHPTEADEADTTSLGREQQNARGVDEWDRGRVTSFGGIRQEDRDNPEANMPEESVMERREIKKEIRDVASPLGKDSALVPVPLVPDIVPSSNPTVKEGLLPIRVDSMGPLWAADCLEMFQDDRSTGDAALLQECERHLNEPRSRGFSLGRWWKRKSTDPMTGDVIQSVAPSLPSLSNDSVLEVLPNRDWLDAMCVYRRWLNFQNRVRNGHEKLKENDPC